MCYFDIRIWNVLNTQYLKRHPQYAYILYEANLLHGLLNFQVMRWNIKPIDPCQNCFFNRTNVKCCFHHWEIEILKCLLKKKNNRYIQFSWFLAFDMVERMFFLSIAKNIFPVINKRVKTSYMLHISYTRSIPTFEIIFSKRWIECGALWQCRVCCRFLIEFNGLNNDEHFLFCGKCLYGNGVRFRLLLYTGTVNNKQNGNYCHKFTIWFNWHWEVLHLDISFLVRFAWEREFDVEQRWHIACRPILNTYLYHYDTNTIYYYQLSICSDTQIWIPNIHDFITCCECDDKICKRHIFV